MVQSAHHRFLMLDGFTNLVNLVTVCWCVRESHNLDVILENIFTGLLGRKKILRYPKRIRQKVRSLKFLFFLAEYI